MNLTSRSAWSIGASTAAFATFVLFSGGARISAQQPQKTLTFTEKGDPDGPTEQITIEPKAIEDLLSGANKNRGPRKNPERMAQSALATAKSYIGVSRRSDPKQVLEFMSPWGFRNINTRYCAMGIAFVYCQAYCEFPPSIQYLNHVTKTFKQTLPDIKKYYFTPSPSCQMMVDAAKRRGKWMARTRDNWRQVKPGWLVLYNWDRKKNGPPVSVLSRAQHVGIVERATNKGLYTVEFNTNLKISGNRSDGGAVAAKTPKERPLNYVIGYIETY